MYATCDLETHPPKAATGPDGAPTPPPSAPLVRKVAAYVTKILRCFGVADGPDEIGLGDGASGAGGGDAESTLGPYIDALKDFRTDVRTAARAAGKASHTRQNQTSKSKSSERLFGSIRLARAQSAALVPADVYFLQALVWFGLVSFRFVLLLVVCAVPDGDGFGTHCTCFLWTARRRAASSRRACSRRATACATSSCHRSACGLRTWRTATCAGSSTTRRS